ncbi:MAG: conjugal transfer protein TrbD [Thiomonas arsenitoxydans]|uniref:Conjugal transfer protein TrbD n=2 Tax=Burkholderiales genera incertae sedis TaxID=224471 RepID=A0A8I1MYC1_THIA3|nr:conjugal transfer protein TrbD [Thiomonas arsenitoxydans]ODU94935.1 MAG: conjugal transfer protein TrbD [Thiomonas sp. SCN 64-16]
MLGGERTLVLGLMTLAGVFVFSLAKLWAAALGIGLWVLGAWALSRAANFDPQLSKTGRRSLAYKRFYPGRATPFGKTREWK